MVPPKTRSVAALTEDADVALTEVTSAYGVVFRQPRQSPFAFIGNYAIGVPGHSVFGALQDADPLGADGDRRFSDRQVDVERGLQWVSGLQNGSKPSLKFVETVLENAGFVDDQGLLLSPYQMSPRDFARLSHDLIKCAGQINDRKWLSQADIAALFDIAVTRRGQLDTVLKIWRCNDFWAPYESDRGSFNIYSVGDGLMDSRERKREFYESDVAIYACHFVGHWTAVVVDHVKANIYFYDSYWKDGSAHSRLCMAFGLIRKYYELNSHPKLLDIFSKSPFAISGIQQNDEHSCGIMVAEFVRCLIREGLLDSTLSRLHQGDCCQKAGSHAKCVVNSWLRWCGTFIGARFSFDREIFHRGADTHLTNMSATDLTRMYERGITTAKATDEWSREGPLTDPENPYPARFRGRARFDTAGRLHWDRPTVSFDNGPVLENTPEPDADQNRAPKVQKTRVAQALRSLPVVRYSRDLTAHRDIKDPLADQRLKKALSREQYLNGFEDPYTTDTSAMVTEATYSIPMRHALGWPGWLKVTAGQVYDRHVAKLLREDAKRPADQEGSPVESTEESFVMARDMKRVQMKSKPTAASSSVEDSFSKMSLDQPENVWSRRLIGRRRTTRLHARRRKRRGACWRRP